MMTKIWPAMMTASKYFWKTFYSSWKSRSDRAVLKTVTQLDKRKIKKPFLERPGHTSKSIFHKAGFPEFSKTNWKITAEDHDIRSTQKRELISNLLTPWRTILRKKELEISWRPTDKIQATLAALTAGRRGGYIERTNATNGRRAEEGVMLRAGIIGQIIIGPIRVTDGD